MCITRTVEHNYNLPISTVRIQLHVSAPICGPSSGWDLTYRSVIQDVWAFVWGLGGGTRPRCFNNGYHDPGLLQVDFSVVVYVHMSSGLLFVC